MEDRIKKLWDLNMIFKQDYFLDIANELEKSIADYIVESDWNYVIIEHGLPLVWDNDKSPIIFGDVNSTMEMLHNCDAIDENKHIKKGFVVLTELEFLFTYCMDAIENILINKILENGEDDGINSKMIYFDESFYNFMDINGCTDILFGMVGNDNLLSFYITDKYDSQSLFVDINAFSILEQLKMISYLLNY